MDESELSWRPGQWPLPGPRQSDGVQERTRIRPISTPTETNERDWHTTTRCTPWSTN